MFVQVARLGHLLCLSETGWRGDWVGVFTQPTPWRQPTPTHPKIMCKQMFLKFQYVAFVSDPDYIFYLNSWLRKHLKAFNSDGNVCFLLLGKSLGVEFTLLPPGDSMLCSSSFNFVGYLVNNYLILLKVWLWKYYGHNCKILGETNCPSILL